MMKKNDVILISVIAFLALALFVFLKLTGHFGAYAVVSVDGKEIAGLPLSEDTVYRIEGVDGYNELVIEDGRAYLSDADCPDRVCVNQGWLTGGRVPIVCLPHRLVIELAEGGDTDALDAVAG